MDFLDFMNKYWQEPDPTMDCDPIKMSGPEFHTSIHVTHAIDPSDMIEPVFQSMDVDGDGNVIRRSPFFVII